MSTPNLKEIHDVLISLAYKAGDIITNALPDNSGTGSKKNSMFGPDERIALGMVVQSRRRDLLNNDFLKSGADLVTEYDRAVENMISTSLKEKYPDYEYVPPPLNPHLLV